MTDWRPDPLLEGFEAKTLEFPPDYDGAVVATLVRLPVGGAPRGAVLYVHGFVDYFFQRHMALRFAQEGYAFHALDLRKHGRSLLAHQHPCFCKRIDEYFPEITRALDEIGQPVLLAGHSTGGLTCSLYAAEGERRDRLRALWLNSPFFDFRARGLQRLQLRIAAALGRFKPFLSDPHALRPDYVKSIHRDFNGEWDFDLRLKPVLGFAAYFGWLAAIADAHARVHAGLGLQLPVLSMHSDEADIVLDWRDIARWSRTLGSRVSVLAFPGGLHDLVLSRASVREEVFRQLFSWAEPATA
jgi:alpha-beta hydrolase superfamily lysophospholipase